MSITALSTQDATVEETDGKSPGRHPTRPLKRLSFFSEYLGVAALALALRCLPRQWALKAGEGIGALCYMFRVRRRVVLKNLEHTDVIASQDREAFMRKLYKTMGRYAADFLIFHEKLVAKAHLNAEMPTIPEKTNTGIVFIGAHFGNWELSARIVSSRYPHVMVVAKPMRNPFFNMWLERKRGGCGLQRVYPQRAFRQTLRVVQRGGVAAYLIDQYAGRRGEAVPFLGKEARTVRSVAGIAALTKCPVVGCYAILNPDGSHSMVFEKVSVKTPEGGGRAATIRAHLHEHNKLISRWVRAYPEHWFGWFHRRFKHAVDYK